MCTKRLQALSRERPLHVRLRRLVVHEMRLVLFGCVALAITLWVIAYEGCILHALTGH